MTHLTLPFQERPERWRGRARTHINRVVIRKGAVEIWRVERDGAEPAAAFILPWVHSDT
jgi:hypothetical protein